MQGMGNKQVSWIQDLKSVANGGERPVSTQKWAPTRIDGGGHAHARVPVGRAQRLLHVGIAGEAVHGKNR